MWILGLTGSIGMGKSATARLFRAMGVPVHDADAAVHALYRGTAVAPVEAAFPGVTRDGAIDRAELGARVLADPQAMGRLEAIVHPLVRAEEEAFLAKAGSAGARLVVLDIPLLFETGGCARVDAVAVVSAPKAVQRARVLERPGMTEAKFEAIVEKQLPDAEKRRRAHFVIDTGRGFPAAAHQVAGIVRALSGPGRRAGG
ncbi:dephospho-CoA kinase [Xanthobacter autotrophicus]|uniref:dephospho-CoA kinase n=1 Tax=Xanthobacter TaxID=279 RepID=UPI0024AC3E79|nr:dephospho-CoA kinase [Xanthobacter autotrophicus]MDI4665128.1 dephospho-CoA kinase [Xanthobacter autotrophicus]